MIKKQNVLT